MAVIRLAVKVGISPLTTLKIVAKEHKKCISNLKYKQWNCDILNVIDYAGYIFVKMIKQITTVMMIFWILCLDGFTFLYIVEGYKLNLLLGYRIAKGSNVLRVG